MYISLKGKDGHWKPAVNLDFLNSSKIDYCPYVSPDKKVLFFTSERVNIPSTYPGAPVKLRQLKRLMDSPQNGSGDIYWVQMDIVLKAAAN